MARPSRAAALSLAAAAAACPAFSEDAGADLGRREYMAGCAVCHGIDARGSGVMAPYLTLPAPDLTTIARDNGGVFPAGLIAEIIEGGGSVAVHGTSEMPAWGDRYAADAYHLLGWPIDPEERAAFVRARILALVEYLATIQVD